MMKKTPYYRDEDNEFLGFLTKDSTSWLAQTIFGYTIARTTTEREAENTLLERGLSSLLGRWQYFDKDDRDWFPCVIKEAYEHKVIVIRTNEYGVQDPDTYKYVVLEHPDESVLVKAE